MLPSKLQYFVNNNTCEYFCNIGQEEVTTLCSPSLYGNGRCDMRCNFEECDWDGGDCMQLCFSKQITNCTEEKLMNNKCDNGCNNKYCSGYAYGQGAKSSFETPLVSFYNDNIYTGIEKSADNFNCISNQSFIINNDFNNVTCNNSNSLYITNEFKKVNIEGLTCEPGWIGDSECDDLCRTDECQHDMNDCISGFACVDNSCYHIYQAWNLFVIPIIGYDIYYINNTVLCDTVYPLVTKILGYDPAHDSDCQIEVEYEDYNNDGVINFREFVPLAYYFGGGWTKKGRQMNCSDCVGMEYYNISP
eukprot:54831_1